MAEEEGKAEGGLDEAWTEQALNLEADEAVGLQAFIRHVNALKMVDEETGVNGFTKEFVSLRRSDDEYKRQKRFPSDVGTAEVNRKKNRYKDIVPFDHSRCMLPEEPGVPGSDYINASFLKVGNDVCPVIAAQGPLTSTVDDYWRMIWHYNIRIIIMCAKVVEAGKQKCAKYWPDPGTSKTHGKIEVTNTKNEEVGEDFNVNTMTISCNGETRPLHHFQYTAWPDHGVPKSPESVLELLRRVRAIQPSLSPPLVIHCSAGCGRTGTIAGIDALWHTLRHNGLEAELDIFETIARFRQQRVAMVQTMDQYLFVYKTTLDLVKTVLDRARNYGDSDAAPEPMYANLPGGLGGVPSGGSTPSSSAPALPAPRTQQAQSAAPAASTASTIYGNLGPARQVLPKEEDPLQKSTSGDGSVPATPTTPTAAATIPASAPTTAASSSATATSSATNATTATTSSSNSNNKAAGNDAAAENVRRQTVALGKQRLRALQDITLPSMDQEMNDEPADFEKYVENPDVSEPASPTKKVDTAQTQPAARGRRYSLSDTADLQYSKRVNRPRGPRDMPAAWPKFRVA
eukprot:m.68145 g.68145  ORF g.68145 m.68145 type:complete len:573 (+) comp14162_c1_seq4:97-1815(+)